MLYGSLSSTPVQGHGSYADSRPAVGLPMHRNSVQGMIGGNLA